MLSAKIQVLLDNELIRRVSPVTEDIQRLLDSAQNGLRDAMLSVSENPVKSFSMGYDAVYYACRAFMLSRGFQADSQPNYVVVLKFCELAMGKREADILDSFSSVEKRRHREMYDGVFSITGKEVNELLMQARKFIYYCAGSLSI